MKSISEGTGGTYGGHVDKGSGFGTKMISAVRGLIESNEKEKGGSDE